MRKFYFLLLSSLLSMAVSASAQTLLDEGFENTRSDGETTEMPDGWEAITAYTGSTSGYRWTLHRNSSSGSTMSGYYYAYCDAPTYDKGDNDGVGPRKDYLITPALTLNGNYQLAFDWEAAAYACLSQKAMTLQVAIIDMANPSDTTVIFDIQNEEQVRDSGVPNSPYNDYMWQNWAIHNSKLDLDAYNGKTVKIAFIYNLQKKVANVIYLDNISVKSHEAITTPIAELSQSTYTFDPMYIGEKHYSESVMLKNVGKKGLKVLGFEGPDCVILNTKYENIDLGVNETTPLQFGYTASLTSPTECDVVVKTNGGDVTLKIKATKEAVPDGYELELFEGTQFAPAGWTAKDWSTTYMAIEGDHSACSSGNITDSYLTTPRLDLTKVTDPKIMFTYYSMFDGEEVPYNDLSVQVSTDGGLTFSDDLWISDYTQNDTLINKSVDLSKYVGDNVKIRFKNSAITYDEDGVDEWTNYILDRVLLPGVYGLDGVPGPSELVAPADSAVNVYTKNITFQWREAQFATGYKFYLGKSADKFDVIDGLDCGTATTYKLDKADYATNYYWKVVPYNSVGNAEEAKVNVFTTQADYSVKTFPWTEDFESTQFAPLGWSAENTDLGKWYRCDYFPMVGKGSAMAYSNETEKTVYLTTPDIQVPADGNYQLSFWWGNEHTVELVYDNTSLHLNNFKKEDGIDAGYFEIFVDGEWKQVSNICNNVEADGKYYWTYESIDLAPYAGKTIQLRWSYISHNYNKSRALSLDNVKIEAKAAQVSFSTDGWDVYKVNYGETVESPVFAITNLGAASVNIEKVEFKTKQFTTNLPGNIELAPAATQQFKMQFTANVEAAEPTEVEDMLTVTFSDGNTVDLPVVGISLPRDYAFYGFEKDATGVVPNGFFGIDVDKATTAPLTFWDFPNNGAAQSFFVLNDSQCYNSLQEPHGSQSLMTRCSEDGLFDDWIVTAKPLTATENSKFVFDARAWESVNSILPSGTPEVSVYVSEEGGTNTANYTQLGETVKLALFDNQNWTTITTDLSAYAGKKVFIAVRANSSDCLGGFYDNFEYQHFVKGLLGDFNDDGMVNSADMAALVAVVIEGDQILSYDVNGDGKVNTADTAALINIILGQNK